MTDDDALQRLEKRLERIEKLLTEIVILARKGSLSGTLAPVESQERLIKTAVKGMNAYVYGESAPDVGDVWSVEESWDKIGKRFANEAQDTYTGFYETEEKEKPEVKKGEIKAEGVPQKGRTARRKTPKA